MDTGKSSERRELSRVSTDRGASEAALWSWSAAKLATAIRERKISSREATLSALQRVASVNPKVNAIVDLLADEALAAADIADLAIKEGRAVGSLHGVPVTIKINVDVKGRPTTEGVVAHRDRIAEDDSSAVRNWRKAGAVIIGRTNTPAMSFRWFTENDLHGRTYNPWDRRLTPGGSSGGAGSAVAVGMGALAHGTDIAGSVRYPAYACGVCGIRPSFGRTPSRNLQGGPISAALMAVQGVLGRSIKDLRLGLEALSAPDPGDPWWTPAPLHWPGSASKLKVALFSHAEGCKPAPSVVAALESAAKALMAAGYIVEEKEPPHFAEGAQLWSRLVINERRQELSVGMEKFGDARLRNFVGAWLKVTPEADIYDFSQAMKRRAAIAAAWDLLFEEYAAVVMPNSWEPPFLNDRDQGGPEAVREILHAQSPMLLPAVLGVPGLSVPTGVLEGVPTGVQIVSRRFREDLCFAVGEVIENAHPMPVPIDPKG